MTSEPSELRRRGRRVPGPPEDLVDAARGGDRDALEELLAVHRPRIAAICRRLLRDATDGDDATQDALVAIVRGLHRFDGRSAFTTWAHRVATNVCLDELRRRARRPRGVDAGLDERAGLEPDPAEAATGSDERRRLAAALDELPEEFRVPVVLRDVADLDYATIAEELGLPAGTVRSRIARGRARLAGVLEPGPGDGGAGGAEGNPPGDADVGRSAAP